MTASETRRISRWPKALAIAALAGGGGGGGAVYVMGGSARNDGASAACAADQKMIARLKPLARGEVAATLVAERPRPLPALTFQGPEGQPSSLSDLRGKTLLLNLWATWCAPCREEMPALDRLQAELGGKDFEVVAVSIDTQDPAKPKRFLEDLKITNLAFRADPTGKLFQDLKKVGRAVGLPTSILIDESGCEIGYLPGPADWASADAKALIGAALAR